MPNLTLSITDAQLQMLRGELAQFVRIATTLDPEFVAPSLEDFANAKISGDTGLLTQESIRQAVQRVPHSLIQRRGDENAFYALACVLRSARLYNFAWVCAGDERANETTQCAKQFAEHIAGELGIDQQHVPVLANALAEAAVPIDTAARVYFPCARYKLSDSLFERADSVYKDIFDNPESGLADVLKWKILAGLAEEVGSLSKDDLAEQFAFIKKLRPELFEREPEDWIDKIATSLKKTFGREIKRPETV